MRIHVSQQIVYDYAPPAKSLIQTLRLTPRNHDGQYVVHWRIDVDVDSRLKPTEDAFANITHQLSVGVPVERLVVRVDGEVQTHDTAGVVRGTVERFPPTLFLRETPATLTDDPLRAFADGVATTAGEDTLGRLHQLMADVNTRLAFAGVDETAADCATTAFAAGRGTCEDHAHVFVAAARHLGIPARTVTGYLWQEDRSRTTGCHAWAEAYVEKLGWVAFDSVLDVCPTTAHVRIAVGLDASGAAPVRGTRYGVSQEHTKVDVSVMAQSQSQS